MSNESMRVGDCGIGEWVRLSTGWWRLGPSLAGGVTARPERDGARWQEDLGHAWPIILDGETVVLERGAPSAPHALAA